MSQRKLEETRQQQDARIPANEVDYWETIMNEAMESGDEARYEMARKRAYGDDTESEELPIS